MELIGFVDDVKLPIPPERLFFFILLEGLMVELAQVQIVLIWPE